MRPGSGVAFDRAGHAARATAAAAELAARDGDDLDAVLAQVGVRRDVPLVPDDDARLYREEVVPVVPLLPLRGPGVLVRLQHGHLVEAERLADRVEEVVVGDDLETVQVVGTRRRQHRPGARGPR